MTFFRAEMAGSGGFGDPFERDPDAVAVDVQQDKMSISHARDEYRVVVDPERLSVDVERTAALRGSLPRPAGPTEP